MRISLALTGALCVCSPAVADITPFLGTYCGEQEIIFIEETGGGFNEHTVCDYLSDPAIKSRSLEVSMACRNVYVVDDTTDPWTIEETNHRDLILRMHRAADTEDYDVFIDGAPIGRFGVCG